MQRGHNTGRRVDFKQFAASCFTPFLYHPPVRQLLGCGATALALLTGIPPQQIGIKKRGAHYSDAFMLRFLRRNGFRTMELTFANRAKAKSKIDDSHVLLLSQWFRHNEGTWVVLHNGTCYHNFDMYTLESLSFVNKPLLSAYVVVHPRWQRPEKPPAAARKKRLSKSALLTLGKLGYTHPIIPIRP